MIRPVWMPHDYQRQGVKWLLSHPSAALFWEPGLGKSSTALEAFRIMRQAGGARKALVIAPLRVAELVWTQENGGEAGKWAQFADLRISLLHGPNKGAALARDADVYVINFDGLPWLTDAKRLDGLLERGVDVLIIDELSKLKHMSTQRFKCLKPYLPRFRRRWGLTGSPAPNGLLDIYGQIYAVDLGKSLGPYFSRFRAEHFTPGGFQGHEWRPMKDAEARIYSKLGDTALAMRAQDHLDLPEMVERDLVVRLPEHARKAYDSLERDLFAEIDGGLVTAANAAVVSGKCRQAASGGVYFDAEGGVRKVAHLHDGKTEALADLVDELQGQPLFVAYEFAHDLERIRGALGNVPAINGDTTPSQAQEIVTAWNAGALPVLAAHPQAAGHGLNLQAGGCHVCWYSLTWNFELYDQCLRRIWRQGQSRRVFVYRILALDTLDLVVAKTLRAKQRGQDSLMVALRDYRKGKQ